MLDAIWHSYLYKPLFNILFYFYDTLGAENLGFAVILLTLALRIVLLPFAVISERNQLVAEALGEKIKGIERDYSNDSIGAKTRIREVMRQHHVSPWAKSVMLGVQVLVLILLYQVFIGGMTATQFQELYRWVPAPERINLNFFGWNVAERRTLFWPIVVSALLFIEISITQRKQKLVKSDIIYRLIFPVFSFLVLWLLPMVKSIFILTSMAFSFVVALIGHAFRPKKKSSKHPV